MYHSTSDGDFQQREQLSMILRFLSALTKGTIYSGSIESHDIPTDFSSMGIRVGSYRRNHVQDFKFTATLDRNDPDGLAPLLAEVPDEELDHLLDDIHQLIEERLTGKVQPHVLNKQTKNDRKEIIQNNEIDIEFD